MADEALFSQPISTADGRQTLAVYRNQEPATVMMERVCAVAECRRADPVIYSKSVTIDGKSEGRIEILRGQEPADVIFAALKPLGVTFEGRRQVFQDIKAANIPFSREHALLFSENILLADDGEFSERFVLLDDGREPVDVIYEFAREHSIVQHFSDLAAALLPQLCAIAVCSREVPLVFLNSINDEDGRHSFKRQAYTLKLFGYSQELLGVVCSSITCTRSVPVVYRKDLNNVNGQHVGGLEILERRRQQFG
ncbi:hypothetical protein ACHAWO_010611 [Cyclotella atomus]|uniref:Uncharacterized protein n=1 Tax=Cyclotella atomus TaxID=382360 RepID=A0ABD3MYV0_9STRA